MDQVDLVLFGAEAVVESGGVVNKVRKIEDTDDHSVVCGYVCVCVCVCARVSYDLLCVCVYVCCVLCVVCVLPSPTFNPLYHISTPCF